MRLLLLFICLSFFSCNNKEKTKNNLNTNLNIKIDTINIAIDTTFMQYYGKTNFNTKNRKLYTYNSSLHRLDYISFNNENKFNGFIQLQKEGPNGVESPNDIYVKNENELFLITYYNIIKIDSEGNIVSKKAINSKSKKEIYKKFYLFPSQDSGFDYNSDDDVFYIRSTNMEYNSSKEPEKYYENSRLISRYNFEEDEPITLEINYPDEFREKDFGFNNLSFICLDSNKIYYSFSPLSDIFTYDFATEKSGRHKISTKGLPYYNYDYKDVSKEYHGMNLETFTHNSNFGPLLSSDQYVIRVYLSSTPEHKVSVDNKSLKESVIQIFDKNLNLLKNLKINSNLGFAGNFNDGEQFYFQIDALNENEIRFLKLSVSTN